MIKESGATPSPPTSARRRTPATAEVGRAPRILQPPRNCWRLAPAGRATFLIDGDAYFSAFRAAAMNARRSLFIVGWDIDSRTELVRGNTADDGYPVQLKEFLETLARRRPELEIYILNWDFIMLYAPDRELLPAFKVGWRNRGRLHFHLDDEHPVGASHHQKIVVIDDAVAFVGGLDLSECRWDTPAHDPHDARRCKPNGTTYPPFHDVQIMVDGDAAAALGELVRERWRRATRHELQGRHRDTWADPWPATVSPDMTDVEVGIVRTEPTFKRYTGVQEARQLFVDAIASARHTIYIENQYLTAHVAREALEKVLRAPTGPEVIIVSRLRGGGWLERNTMTVLRARLLKTLRAADAHGRLRVYYPDQAGLRDQCIDLHSKVMIIDDRFVRVGSTNLNNRSMGLDTECDLAIETPADASGARIMQAAAHFRNRLLAEHLGVEPQTVARTLEQKNGSLIATIEALQGGPRTLKSLTDEIAPEIDALVPDAAVIDPEEPIDPDRLMDELIPADANKSGAGHVAAVAITLLIVAGLAALWRWSPLSEWVNAETIARAAETLGNSPTTWLWVMGGFLVASLTAIPITALIIASVVIFGPLEGFTYALLGSVLGAAVTFGLGKLIGRRAVRRLAGRHINKLSRKLGQHGILAILALRVLPVAPFTIVNLAAGASHIGLRDFLIGTVLGMLPGMIAISLFSDRLAAVMRDPSPTALAILAIVVIVVVGAILAVRAWLKRHSTLRVATPHSNA